MRTLVAYVLGVSAIMLATTSAAFAGTNVAPEIDANLVSAGLGVLAAGVLIVRSRRRK